jgi:ligand-binding sensor domain-containing protein
MIVVNVMLTKSKQSVFLFILLLFAQQVSAQFKSLRFDRITIEDGLPNPSAMDILQDSLGFIWISTLSGIVRYDGIAMRTYLPEATTIDSLPSREHSIPVPGQSRQHLGWLSIQPYLAKAVPVRTGN